MGAGMGLSPPNPPIHTIQNIGWEIVVLRAERDPYMSLRGRWLRYNHHPTPSRKVAAKNRCSDVSSFCKIQFSQV
jgi:hypothetical protein